MWITKKGNVFDVRAINEFAESTKVYLLLGVIVVFYIVTAETAKAVFYKKVKV
jgi:hypothetical protein